MICSWCKTKNGVPMTTDEYAATINPQHSHGICAQCARALRQDHKLILAEAAMARKLSHHEQRLLNMVGWEACQHCDHVHPGGCNQAIASTAVEPKAALNTMAHVSEHHKDGVLYTIADQRYPSYNGKQILFKLSSGKTVYMWSA